MFGTLSTSPTLAFIDNLQVQTLLVGITNHSTFVDDPSYAHKIKLPLPPSLFRPLQLLVAMQ
eukprot:806426-Pelagomonas_calceolata.AAC.6